MGKQQSDKETNKVPTIVNYAVMVLLILVAMEFILRLGGFVYWKMHLHDQVNHANSTVLSLGDSTTFGFGVGPSESYSDQLEMLLNDGKSSTTYDVINRGVPAQTSTSVLRYIDYQMIKYDPDAVIILIGINDFNDELNEMSSLKGVALLKDLNLYKLVSLIIDAYGGQMTLRPEGMGFYMGTGRYGANYEERLTTILKHNYKEIISTIKEDYGKEVYVLEYISCGTMKVNQLNEQITKETGAVFVPIENYTIQCDDTELFTRDRWHPNNRGHELIAKSIYNKMSMAQE